ALEADQFQEADLGNGVAVAGAGHGQGRNDRQRQRDLHADGRAASRPAFDRHRTADLLDVRPHHIHADAAAGKLRYLVGRGEAGKEDEVQKLAVVQPARLFGCYQPRLDRLGANALRVDAAAVVGDLDDDLAALVEGVERDATLRRLAAGHALRGRLDSVIDGVADQVRQRVADRLDDALVEFGFVTFHFELCLLLASRGQVADHA